MHSELERTELLLGREAQARLRESSVIVFGIGGVGGHVVEVMARSGIGTVTLVDADTVELSNINRQIIALHSTVGRPKVEVAEQRIRDINPDCNVKTFQQFYLPENADSIDLTEYDYVIDCIDTVSAKVELIRRCDERKLPIISSMGAGNRMNPAMLKVTDIYKTTIDPLAKAVRKECRKNGIKSLKVVCSDECPQTASQQTVIASNAFVPAAMGIMIASEVIKDLIKI
ncbi:MAG: tRNA threonylcarbamoyladenosine dehydratase [Prevotella sp.]|nr:tRNA threonylcarbamoyladenosine dehydratase [Candidatus Equicola stercoris]